jgi:aryl-alcohol dehydrogenase-like predicted oxidoreductase
VACVLVGARNAEQVNDNAQSLSFSLTEDELNEITKAADEFHLAEEKVV